MEFIRHDDFVDLPPKVDNNHRWIILAMHTITQADIDNGATPVVGKANLTGFSVGCVDCGLDHTEANGAPCLATDKEVSHANEVTGPRS